MSIDFVSHVPISSRISIVYLYREVTIPLLDLATPILKVFQRSKVGLQSFLFIILGDHNMICLINIITLTPLLLMNTVCSTWHLRYPYQITALLNLSNYTRGNCFSPYKAFLSRQTFISCPFTTKTVGASIYSSSCKSPWRNASFYISLIEWSRKICC